MMTGATPSRYSARACSSRASKIDDGTPLYCAEPSTTIASEPGRESLRGGHQIANPGDPTSSTNRGTAAQIPRPVDRTGSTKGTTAAPITLVTRPPPRSRHGYHARPTPRGHLGRAGHHPAGSAACQRRRTGLTAPRTATVARHASPPLTAATGAENSPATAPARVLPRPGPPVPTTFST